MEGNKHFSHDHSLTTFVDNEVDDYTQETPSHLCNICGLPILSSPSYTCTTNGCNFFLHKPCAELTKELYHPNHDPSPSRNKTLHLKPKLPSVQNFTYKCEGCEFEIHPLFVLQAEIKSKHKSHQAHPLVAIRKEISSQCDACGEKQNGFFFSCQQCNFWIHQDCILLPSFAKLPSRLDPFILTYSLPTSLLRGANCVICDKRFFPRYDVGVYFSGGAGWSFAHVSCAKSRMKVLDTESIRQGFIQLPDEGDVFPSLVIRSYLERNPLTQQNDDEEYHKHPLIIDDGVSSSIDGEASCNLMCDVCIQPINTLSPFYRCLDCDFLAHIVCADHLCRVKFPLGEDSITILCPDPSNLVFNSIFPCYICRRPCNGLCYYGEAEVLGLLFIDPECVAAWALNTIKHDSHKQHILFQSDVGPGTSLSCCSDVSHIMYVFRCLFCNFYIHARCALLPKRTQHNKFDEHPLELITQTHHHQSLEEQYCYLCEVCEKVIDHKYWYYGCHKCGNYFHINCIPSVGYLSKVKFGKTLVDNNIHPHHPLTLTRMLTHETHERCGYCNQIIKGFVDEMAFHCLDCDFWIHFFCAWAATDKTSRPRLEVYSDVEKRIEDALHEHAHPAEE